MVYDIIITKMIAELCRTITNEVYDIVNIITKIAEIHRMIKLLESNFHKCRFLTHHSYTLPATFVTSG